MKKADVALLLIWVALTIGLTVQQTMSRIGSEADRLIVVSEGNVVREIFFPLKDQTVVVKNQYGTNTVSIENGKVRMVEADCRDQLCVYSKPISLGGDMIVCLPHEVYIEVKTSKASDLDGFAH